MLVSFVSIILVSLFTYTHSDIHALRRCQAQEYCNCGYGVSCSGVPSAAHLKSALALINDPGGRSFSLESSSLEILPNKVFENIFTSTYVSITSNPKLTAIEPLAFYPNVKGREVYIKDNAISSSTVFHALSHMDYLVALYMSNNRLKHIPSYSFSRNMTSLAYIDLSNNLIESIGTYAFINIRSISRLSLVLTNNRLYHIGSYALALFPQVSVDFNFTKNMIRGLSKDVFGTGQGNRIKLALDDNKIFAFPEHIYVDLLKYVAGNGIQLSLTGNRIRCDQNRFTFLMWIKKDTNAQFLKYLSCENGQTLGQFLG